MSETATAKHDVRLTPQPLMQLATAHWAFKSLAAAHELDLFTHLSEHDGSTAAEWAEAAGIDERPAEILLTACASLALLEKERGRYRNSPLAEEFLVRGRPNYFGGFVAMQDRLIYPAYARAVDAARTNRPTAYDAETQSSLFEDRDPVLLETFWEAMHALSTFTARALAEAVDLSGFRRLLDVGGGSGAFDIELCSRYPELRATVYDLPFVTPTAASKAEAAGVADRIEIVAGDYYADEMLPKGHDLLLLSLILHSETDERNLELLRKCFAALEPGGTILVSELLVDEEKTGPAPAALMSMTMLIASDGGRNRTADEYAALLCRTGFIDIEVIPFGGLGASGAIRAIRPQR